jgi:hypothetical protein
MANIVSTAFQKSVRQSKELCPVLVRSEEDYKPSPPSIQILYCSHGRKFKKKCPYVIVLEFQRYAESSIL